MKVWDAVCFHNELDHLAARIETLKGAVDHHVAVEGSHTHQGRPRSRMICRSTWNIIDVQADLSGMSNAWQRENAQRDTLVPYLRMVAEPDDLVLVCDVDEHVNPEIVDHLVKATEDGPLSLGMRLFYYSLAWEDTARDFWLHAKAMRVRDMPDALSDLRVDPLDRMIYGAGWHISYTGDPLRRADKLRAFAHVEQNTAAVHDRVRHGPVTGLGPNKEMLTKVDNYDGIPAPLVERFG